MANYFAAAALRAQFAKRPAVADSPHREHPFTEAHHRLEAQLREACDFLALAGVRWSVRILPRGDTMFRQFVMTGSYESVSRRANVLFDTPSTIVIEPCRIQVGYGEQVDRRLSDLTSRRI